LIKCRGVVRGYDHGFDDGELFLLFVFEFDFDGGIGLYVNEGSENACPVMTIYNAVACVPGPRR